MVEIFSIEKTSFRNDSETFVHVLMLSSSNQNLTNIVKKRNPEKTLPTPYRDQLSNILKQKDN